MSQLEFIAASAFGLEAVVARELAALGYEAKGVGTGRVLFRGDLTAICRANLWLRTADRVLVRMAAFSAKDFGELFDRTYELPWQEWISADAAFPVRGRSIKSQLSSVPACQKIVKKAVVEKLKAAHGVDLLPESGPLYPVEIALLGDEATLLLDTTGPSLHKRGYRKLAAQAQLKETLAAALVLLSFWRPDRPLVDPFCGTGTIPIEAALIGRKIAPGLHRSFAAEAWPCITPHLWEEARREARDLVLPDLPERIMGTDVDPEALSLARYHAEQARVADDIHFQQRDFRDLRSKKSFGCLITNPPYGERMGEESEVRDLYRKMPDVLRWLKTWSHFILTADPEFERLVGQQADRRRKLYNGRIECTYYQFYGPKPGRRSSGDDSTCEVEQSVSRTTGETAGLGVKKPLDDSASRDAMVVPAFGGLSAKALEQAELFRSRLAKRARHLRRWPKRGITCFRLYDRDIPEVPLVVDRYERCLHMAEYDRPHDRSPAEHADWLDLMAKTAGEALDVARDDVYLKRRERQRGLAQYDRQSTEGRAIEVSEGGLRFLVNLSDYLDTGLFLDHRQTRAMVRDVAEGKRFLNLFGYTGSFTVYAAAGGAVRTTTVDLSKTYLDWARENMQLNGFSGPAHQFIREDALTFLRERTPEEPYELAVVDVPTFSNSKSTEADWEVQRDHAELLTRLLGRITPGGTIFFSTNFRRFKFDESKFPNCQIQEISRQTVPEDFRNRRIHRCWRIGKAS